MDSWDLLMEYLMMVIAGASGGLTVTIFLNSEFKNSWDVVGRCYYVLFLLLLGFIAYFLFAKSREISRKN